MSINVKGRRRKARRKKDPKTLRYGQRVRFILGGMGILLAAAMFTVFLMERIGEHRLLEPKLYDGAEGEEAKTEMPEILWNGDVYGYREDLVTLLCLGIDGRETAIENTAIGFGPRADSIYLAVLDLKQEKLTLLNISRDSMTSVHMFDSLGQDVGYYEMQLGLQYANGDGLEQSCELTAAAVSRLLDGIPIHGYCALYWNGIGALHEEIGPVAVWVPEDLKSLDPVTFPESGRVKLTRKQALVYVQGRDIRVTGSNETRSLRQQEYVKALAETGRRQIRRNPLKLFPILQTVKEYMITDLTSGEFLALASRLKDWDLSSLDIRMLPGQSLPSDFQDEYWVSPGEKQELLIELFYEKRY